MVTIPGGSFNMGYPTSPHQVTVDGFFMDASLVSYDLWKAVRDWGSRNGYSFAGGGMPPADPKKLANYPGPYPANNISWYEATKWSNARSEMEGLEPAYYTDEAHATVYKSGSVDLKNAWVKWDATGYRLPTEAEWERAARGGIENHYFPWGTDTVSDTQANYRALTYFQVDQGGPGLMCFLNTRGDKICGGTNPTYTVGGQPFTSPVFPQPKPLPATFPPNAYGLYDMAGNLFQWTWDRYALPKGAQVNPRGPEIGSQRTTKGGAWTSYAPDLYCGARTAYSPGSGIFVHGFRCVRSR
jgi:formylglycine-generating enzyme required for sulfatase activity